MPVVTSRMIGDKYKLWAHLWMARRQNPGGTSPLIDGCLLGFAGTIDVSEALDSGTKTGEVRIKVGTAKALVKTANFSAVNPKAITPSDAAQVLNALAVPGASFGVHAATGRLMLKAADSSVRFTQIYGDLAGALNFGGCRFSQGRGCYFYSGFSKDLKTVTPTIEWNEDTTIENDNGWGDKVIFTTPGGRGKATLSIVDRRMSVEMKQMVDGGYWIPGTITEPESYEQLAENDNPGERRLDAHIFTDLFQSKRNAAGSHTHVQEDIFIGAVGHSTETGGGGSWTDGQYDFTAGSYVDAANKERVGPKTNYYTRAQWEALDLSHIIVSDWENI